MLRLDPHLPLPSSEEYGELGRRVTLDSARLEIMYIMWRIGEALAALPDSPDEGQRLRWKNGLARELVRK